MNKICIIRQPAGLGDIFFTQKIARTVLDRKEADTVIWPVIKEYSYLSNYLINDGVTFINEEEEFPFRDVYLSNPKGITNTNDLLYISLQSADSIFREFPIMQAKYRLYGIPYLNWTNYFDFTRNPERENYLENYLNIKEPFILINNNYGSKDYAYLKNTRNIPEKENCVYIKYLSFDNVFDWIGILERASEIHTVDTVWCYLLEKLGLKNVTVYSRKKDPTFFNYVHGIFNPEWKYVL